MKFQPFSHDSPAPRRFFTVLSSMIAVDIAKTLLAVLSVLVLIILSNKFVSMLAKAFEGQISSESIFLLLGFRLISIAIGFLPPAVFAAVLLVLGRMYHDSEMSALAAGGAGMLRIYYYVFVLVVPLSMVALGLALFVQPWSVEQANDLFLQEAQTMHLRLITPGKFSEYSKGDLVFYVETIAPDNTMHNIFVHTRHHHDTEGVVAAKRGYQKDLPSGQYIVLEDGYRYEGQPGQADYEVTQFKTYAIRISENTISTTYVPPEAKPTVDLWQSDDPADIAELYQRLSIPFGMLVLAFLAIPLARMRPRGGVYGNILVAFLVYVIYENLLKVSHSWLGKATLPVWMGDWWVYMIMLAIALILLTRVLGVSWMVSVLTGKTGSGWGLIEDRGLR